MLAEHAIDLHADLFGDLDEKLIALDALARDLIRMSRLHPEIIGFLRRVDDYIQILQHDIEAARRPRKVGATVSESGIPAAQDPAGGASQSARMWALVRP